MEASPALKAALGIRDGQTPGEAVRSVLDQAPELADGLDTEGLDEDIAAWKDLRTKRDTATKLNTPTMGDKAREAAIWAATRAARLRNLPSIPAKAAGLMGEEETLGSLVREKMSPGPAGAFVGGATDAITDPVTALSLAGGGLTGPLLKKVGALMLAKQGYDVGKVGLESGVTSPEFGEALAGAAGGLAAGVALPAAVGRMVAPRTPVLAPEAVRSGAPRLPTDAASGVEARVAAGLPPISAGGLLKSLDLFEAGARAKYGENWRTTAPDVVLQAHRRIISQSNAEGGAIIEAEVVRPPAAPQAPPEAPPAAPAVKGPSERAAKVAADVQKAETRVMAAESALAYQRSQRGGTGTEQKSVDAAKAKLAAAKRNADIVQRFEALGDDDLSWVDAVTAAQEGEGATRMRPEDDILNVFKGAATGKAMAESGIDGRGRRVDADGNPLQFESAADAVRKALGLPEGNSYSETRENDSLVEDAIQRARTGSETVLTPEAIEGGVAGVPYREQAASQGLDLDALIKLHKRAQAGADLTPPQMERYVAAVKAARGLDIGRGSLESYTYDDHASRRALNAAAAEDLMNLDAEPEMPINEIGDASFNPDDWAGNASQKRLSTQRTAAGNQILAPWAAEAMDTTGKIRPKAGQLPITDAPLFTQEADAAVRAEAESQANLFGNERTKKTGAPPPSKPVPPTSPAAAPSGPVEAPVDLSKGPNRISIEKSETEPGAIQKAAGYATGKAPSDSRGPLRRAIDWARSVPGTLHSNLIKRDMPATAAAFERISGGQKYWGQKNALPTDIARAQGWTEADVKSAFKAIQKGEPTGKDKEVYDTLVRNRFGPQYERATEKDPPRGNADDETLNGVAPRTGPLYWPMTGDRPKGTFKRNEIFRDLETTGQSKSPHLYKERLPEGNSVPILTFEGLEEAGRMNARTVGALHGGAQKPRTPEAYPKVFKLLVANERGKATGDNAEADAQAAARNRLDSIQLPDLYEAAATDRPASSWSDLVKNDLLSKTAAQIVKGHSDLALDEGDRALVNETRGLAAAAQLMFAAPRNYLGLQTAGGMGYDAARDAGSGRVMSGVHAAKTLLHATGSAAKNTVQDVAMYAGRMFGRTDDLSPAQKFEGGESRLGPKAEYAKARASGSGVPMSTIKAAARTVLNIPMRAVVAGDRSAGLGVAEAMRADIPRMGHSKFRTTDKTLPIEDPKNIDLAMHEIADDSQGRPTAADSRAPTGKSGIDAGLSLASQYTGPEMRLLEKGWGKLSTGGKVATALSSGLFSGELVNDAIALMRGGGLNLPGTAEETTDQKRNRLRSIISNERSPNLGVRFLQNMVPGLPMMKQVMQSKEYGDIPFLGLAPSAALVLQITKTLKTVHDTNDLSPLLGIVNAPGFDKAWSQIAKYEDARRKARATGKDVSKAGLGYVPQNLTYPWRLHEFFNGSMTAKELIDDATLHGGPRLWLEKQANVYRADLNKKQDARDAKK